MSFLLCCIKPASASADSCVAKEHHASGEEKSGKLGKSGSPSKAVTASSLGGRLSTSLDISGDDSAPRRLHPGCGSSRPRCSGLRMSEDTVVSALSTTPTSLNPLSYFLPFGTDDHDEFSSGQPRMAAESLGPGPPQQPRSKVEFADLCGSLEDLYYVGEGSNGVVYSASWHGARVAVKFLLGNNDDSTHLQRCFTEAVLTRVLSHPCVVQCFATAIAALTPEVWEAIRTRCRRHQTLLQTTSLGRCMTASVQQQESHDQQRQQQELENDRAEASILEDLQMGLMAQSINTGHNAGGNHNQLSAAPRSSARPPCPDLPPAGCGVSTPRGGNTPRASFQQERPQQYSQQAQQAAMMQGGCPSASLQQSPTYPRVPASGAGVDGNIRSSSVASGGPLMRCGGRTSACSNDNAIDREAGERAALDMRKVETYFACEDATERRGGGGGGSGGLDMLGLMVGDGSEQPRGGGDGAAGQQAGEGVSLMQALIDLQADAGRHCTVVVMEYMDAGTMHAGIVRGDFSARRSLEHRPKLLSTLLTAQELAQGMAHLHGLDILHGDLKPTNVLLKGSPCQYAPAGAPGANGFTCTDPRGYTAKIADLGLARPCTGETAQLTSDQWGALAYLAPEAAKGSCCKPSDVYSFGVMLWEMAAGVRPYLGLTTPQVLMGLVTGTLQLTWPCDGSIYAPLRSLGIACTDPNPAERPTFEVAARILGRMVRHIRSATEPLRQRHSSAMSMEMGGGGSACHSPGGPGPKVPYPLNHAPRSMPMYMPAAAGAPRPSTATGVVPRTAAPPLTTLAAGNLTSGPCGTSGAAALPSRAMVASSLSMPGGVAGVAPALKGLASATAASPSYPRARHGGGGGYCGTAVMRSPLGGAASFRLPTAAAAQGTALPAARSPIGERPGSSPAHAHVVHGAAQPLPSPQLLQETTAAQS